MLEASAEGNRTARAASRVRASLAGAFGAAIDITDGTDASPGQFAAHRYDQAQSQA